MKSNIFIEHKCFYIALNNNFFHFDSIPEESVDEIFTELRYIEYH